MNDSVSPLKAVGLAVAAYTCWVLADTSLKVAGATILPTFEVITLVGVAEMILLLANGARRNDAGALWPKHVMPQLFRSCLDLANNVCVVIALRHLPLALFYILIFLAPMTTTLLATVFLREQLGWRQGLALVMGFLGVVVAVDPFGTVRPGDRTGYLACLVCVGCFSANIVWSRVITQTEAPESMTFFSGLVMAVAGSAAMLWHAEPLTAKLAAVLFAAGLFSVMGSMCFFVAVKHTSAANVSQYHYSQLLTGALIAYLLWHERLTSSMLLGAVLILAAGGYTAAASDNAR